MSRHFRPTESGRDAARGAPYAMAERCRFCAMRGAALCRAMAETRPSLSSVPTVRRFSKGQVIFEHGAAPGLGVMTRGYARRSTMRVDGKRILLELAVPGDILTGLPGHGFACDLEAATEVEICFYDSGALQWIMAHNHRAASQLLREVEDQHHRQLDALWQYGGLTSRERIIAFLVAATAFMPVETLPDGGLVLSMEIDRRDWADLTNTAVETISRTLRYLEEKRLVTALSPYRFRITDLTRLAIIAGVDMPRPRPSGPGVSTLRAPGPDATHGAERLTAVNAGRRPAP
jgi:CRP-like cAMP-binding protein